MNIADGKREEQLRLSTYVPEGVKVLL
ncbi:uncharacterized protein METZ01_LOCUS299330 [marine metagenome]|uniref:Uncharacterized protein n=1 Tax=marine metagenome TaxID=408172 RepID=A0A382MCE5_9ZZZZ